mmetsp:Transcript_42755/g.98978  ORF Transcript_42755/g.98978 Transcript_42755/m.98978 type:complete len:263 (+) Transcript_42755:543-1331(+)
MHTDDHTGDRARQRCQLIAQELRLALAEPHTALARDGEAVHKHIEHLATCEAVCDELQRCRDNVALPHVQEAPARALVAAAGGRTARQRAARHVYPQRRQHIHSAHLQAEGGIQFQRSLRLRQILLIDWLHSRGLCLKCQIPNGLTGWAAHVKVSPALSHRQGHRQGLVIVVEHQKLHVLAALRCCLCREVYREPSALHQARLHAVQPLLLVPLWLSRRRQAQRAQGDAKAAHEHGLISGTREECLGEMLGQGRWNAMDARG